MDRSWATRVDKDEVPRHRSAGGWRSGPELVDPRIDDTQGQSMRIQVSGKQIDIGDALRTHVEDRLNETVGKFSDRPVEAVVTFSKDRHEFVSDSSVHLATGMTVQAKGRAHEVYASFEGAVERMEKQLRRYKRRLKDHHRARELPIEVEGASAYILEGGAFDDEEQASAAAGIGSPLSVRLPSRPPTRCEAGCEARATASRRPRSAHSSADTARAASSGRRSRRAATRRR